MFLATTISAAAPTVLTFQSSIPVTIPDGAGTLTLNRDVSNTGQIADVDVKVRIAHPQDPDLAIVLRHTLPDSSITTVTLTPGSGASGVDYGTGATDCTGTLTVFDDEASTAITAAAPPYAGSFKPTGVLSSFDGQTPQGSWKLDLTDSVLGPSAGTIYCWEIDITLAQVDLVVTLADSPDPAAVGADLTYTATVKNNGPDPSSLTTLTMAPPTGATLGTVTPSQGTCATDPLPVKCDLGALAANATATVAFVVKPATAGTASATATASSGATELVPADNSATTTTTVQESGSGGSELITVDTLGTGRGVVTSEPSGINCGMTCTAGFFKGTKVTLTVAPASNAVFEAWGGVCEGVAVENPCVLTADGNLDVTATFTKTSGSGGSGGSGGGSDGTGSKFFRCTITGTDKANVLRGTPKKDVICGLAGNDKIYGLGGDDVLIGGAGKDVLVGGAGNDTFYSRDSSIDKINGGPGKDRVSADLRDAFVGVEAAIA